MNRKNEKRNSPIRGILDCLAKDVQSFRSRMQACLDSLAEDPRREDAARELEETAHALKGTAAMGELPDLQGYGERFEILADVAQSFLNGAPEKAVEIFGFLRDRLPLLGVLLERALAGKPGGGSGEYLEFERRIQERWGDYLDPYISGMYRLPDEESDRLEGKSRGDWASVIAGEGGDVREIEGPPTGPAEDEHLGFLGDGNEQVPFETGEDEVDFLDGEKVPAREDSDGGLLEVFHEEVRAIFPELKRLLAEFRKAPGAGVARGLERIFHTLKGSAATVDLPKISDMARELEDALDPFLEGNGEIPREMPERLAAGARRILAEAHLVDLVLEEEAAGAAASPAAAAAATATEIPGDLAGEDADLVEAFFLDADENIEAIERALLQLEKSPETVSLWEAVYRAAHTLKGAANTMGHREIASLVHAVEDALDDVLEGNRSIDVGRLPALLLEVVDGLRLLLSKARGKAIDETRVIADLPARLEALKAATAAVGPARTAPTAATTAAETAAEGAESDSNVIRVNTDRLNALMNLVGELVVNRAKLDRKLALLDDLKKGLNFCRSRLVGAVGTFQEKYEFSSALAGIAAAAVPAMPAPEAVRSGGPPQGEGSFSELEFDRYDDFSILSRSLIETATDISEIIESIGNFFGSFSEESSQFRKITTTLQDEITRVRMVPVSSLFQRLRRPIRDAARQEGREVRVEMQGGEAELDKTIVDRIYTPLLHIVRNAVAHGIEAPMDRLAAGKAREGSIVLKARHESGQIIIEVEDDGAGIRPERVFAIAVPAGLARGDEPPTMEKACEIIFKRGFSTRSSGGQVSGRGVGLDVVKRETERLNGTVRVLSEPGEGSRFTIGLPMTMTIHQALLVGMGKETLAIPLNLVQSTMLIPAGSVGRSGGSEMVMIRDAIVPLGRLGTLLGLPSEPGTAGSQALVTVLLQVNDRLHAVVVDRILGKGEIVVKSIGKLLQGHRMLSGATLSGDGRIILILDLPGILVRAPGEAVEAMAPAVPSGETLEETSRVLVVDDSISVRKVASKYLQSAGVPADTAVDGLEALEKMRTTRYALVFTDLEMPRLNGYELIAEIRRQPASKGLPIVVITSRAGDKHREKASRAGATDYLTKPFSRDQLVEAIRRHAPASVAVGEGAR